MTDLLIDAALGYAAAGWPVFPCVTPSKVPLTPHGFKDATTEPGRIRAWWSRWPRANVAVATGAPGPDVLDVDTKDSRDGMDLFDRARRAGLVQGAGAIIRTPSGGLHVWFDGTEQPGGAVGRHKALELKARGGYVLLPPSYVEDATYGYAGQYELIERRDSAGVVDFAAIRRLLDPPRTEVRRTWPGGRDVGSLARWLAGQGSGNRNKALYWAACRAVESGCGDLGPLVDAAVGTGLPEYEAERTVQSAKDRLTGARS